MPALPHAATSNAATSTTAAREDGARLTNIGRISTPAGCRQATTCQRAARRLDTRRGLLADLRPAHQGPPVASQDRVRSAGQLPQRASARYCAKNGQSMADRRPSPKGAVGGMGSHEHGVAFNEPQIGCARPASVSASPGPSTHSRFGALSYTRMFRVLRRGSCWLTMLTPPICIPAPAKWWRRRVTGCGEIRRAVDRDGLSGPPPPATWAYAVYQEGGIPVGQAIAGGRPRRQDPRL